MHPLGPIAATSLAFDSDGTPYSEHYGDVYHSRAGGTGQARTVFLAGNRLPERWGGATGFTLLETGFGLGTNFLTTWAAWRDDPQRPQRLDYVSIERSPFVAADLLRWHAAGGEHHDLARELAARWPAPIAGVHRMEFEYGAVVLTLVLGEFARALAQLRCAVDAFFLDGFAPSRNPDAWSHGVFRGLARLAAPGATVASYTTARTVVAGLQAVGFQVQKAPGFSGKRERLIGQFAPRYIVRRHDPPARAPWPARSALVIGAGIAGQAVGERLAARGWQVSLIDQSEQSNGSVRRLPAGAIYPLIARDESHLARLTRAGFLWQTAGGARHSQIDFGSGGGADQSTTDCGGRYHPSAIGSGYRACGYVDLAIDERAAERAADTLRVLGLPAEFAQAIDATAASETAGLRVKVGGTYFPQGGLVVSGHWPLARAVRAVDRLVRREDPWLALDAHGAQIAAASVAVVATGAGSYDRPLHIDGHGPLDLPCAPVRGQLSGLDARHWSGPRCVLGGAGLCVPAIDSQVWIGASYSRENRTLEPLADDDAANLARLARLVPGLKLDRAMIRAHYVGLRAVAADRMPLVGAWPATGAGDWRSAHLPDLPRTPGLYICGAMGSRGLTWAGIAAETLASLIEGEPVPIEADLLDAIDPARFALARLRRQPGGS